MKKMLTTQTRILTLNILQLIHQKLKTEVWSEVHSAQLEGENFRKKGKKNVQNLNCGRKITKTFAET